MYPLDFIKEKASLPFPYSLQNVYLHHKGNSKPSLPLNPQNNVVPLLKLTAGNSKQVVIWGRGRGRG